MTHTKKRLKTAIVLIAGALIAFPLAAQSEIVKLEAIASYYGEEFNGRPTSSGETFDMNALTAAHKTLPFGTLLEVTNLENGKKAVVRVNDRGPFVADRELDVSKAAAVQLGMIATGTARVSIKKLAATDSTATAAATSSGNTPEATVTAASPDTAQPPDPVVSPAPATAAATTLVASPVLANAPTGIRWRIQLGSFSNEENASRLVARLRKDGFTPAYEKSGTLTRVVITGIADGSLAPTRSKLDSAGYGEYLVRQESW